MNVIKSHGWLFPQTFPTHSTYTFKYVWTYKVEFSENTVYMWKFQTHVIHMIYAPCVNDLQQKMTKILQQH